MTGKEIYSKAKAFMFEDNSSTSYDEQIIPIINKVLAELYEENNLKRVFKDKLPFVDGKLAHQIESLSDALDYEDEYQIDVIPRGVASYLFMDDDLNKMNVLNTEYNNSRNANLSIVSNIKYKAALSLAKEEQDAN